MPRTPPPSVFRPTGAIPGPAGERGRRTLPFRRALLGAALLLPGLLPSAASGQEVAVRIPATATGHDFPLSIREIMRGPELLGTPPSGVRWTDDSSWIHFQWKPAGARWDAPAEPYRVRAEGGEPERLTTEEADSLAAFVSGGALSPDRRLRATVAGGALLLVDRRDRTRRTLLRTAGTPPAQPRFTADGRRVLYRQGDDLFAIDIHEGGVEQLTDLRSGPAPRDPVRPGEHRDFLEAQQLELFQHLRWKAERDSIARSRRPDPRPAPVHLAASERVASLVPDPHARRAAVVIAKRAEGQEPVSIPFWVTESGYTEPRDMRGKVGEPQGSSRVGILPLEGGEPTWLDLEGAVAGDPDLVGEHSEGSNLFSTVNFLGWNDAGTTGLVAAISSGYELRWIWSVDGATGGLTLLDRHHDEAWIAGPCSGCGGWIPDEERAWFVSEATGFAQLYSVASDGTDRRALTEGDWEVLSVEIPESRDFFLLRTNEGSPFDQHVSRMDFSGANRVRITSGEGHFSATLSPDGRRMAVVHSRANRPGELFVAPFRAGAELDQVTVSPSAEWLTFPWIVPEIVRFTARDGVSVPARIYRPEDVGAEPNGAAVLFVHGAGYLQNVHNWWSSYSREYMFHHLLAAEGYTVLDVDYRGSSGYGRDWRTGIYRHMGGKDLTDHSDAVRWLIENEGVVPGRVGIYGGSYGGFITLMALFTEPDLFTSGAALRAVTDWAHYNHGYTARILNQPQEDEESYRRSSPIYLAEGFQPHQHLLIAHGMVDVNVHFSDVVRLAQRLIELGKENWEMAVYPVEDHGFVEPSSWTDEYRRIFELFERTIREP